MITELTKKYNTNVNNYDRKLMIIDLHKSFM